MLFIHPGDLRGLLAPADHPPLPLATPILQPERDRLRHLIIGSPENVRAAIHQLHVLQYAEQLAWSQLITVPASGLTITSEQGEVLSLLRRDRPGSTP